MLFAGSPPRMSRRVLVVGDVMTDVIVVPEGPIVKGSDRRATVRSRRPIVTWTSFPVGWSDPGGSAIAVSPTWI